MAYDPLRQRVVLFGGSDSTGGDLGDTWEWDGTSWTQRMVSGPGARKSHRMAYDVARQRMVLYGGYGASGYFSDTWEFDGASWTQRSPTGLPSRYEFAMAYDTTRQRVVLFGGSLASGPPLNGSGETWEWDGSMWSRRMVPAPSGRRTVGAYDTSRRRLVIFGGNLMSGPPLSETWEWDGAAWSNQTTIGPPGRGYHGMVFDSRRGRVVIFGGMGTGLGRPVLSDTWEWDGSSWLQRTIAAPSARSELAVAYDAARQRIVLFGGASMSGTTLGDTWMWDGTSLQP